MWFITILILIIPYTESVVKLPANVTVPAVIVFGDSYVDQGMNNNRLTLLKSNFPPYGMDFMGGLATGRFSNGKTPPDILGEALGIKEAVPAYLDPNLTTTDLLTGVSFASAGAGFDPQTSKINLAISMEDQLELFKEYINKLKTLVGEGRTNYIIANSYYVVVAGSNDLTLNYFAVSSRRLQYDVPSYADLVVNYSITFLQGLYDVGARRIAVHGDTPIGCLPLERTLAGGITRNCVDKYNQAAQLYNSKLSSRLTAFVDTLPQSIIVYIDIYTPLLDVIQNPQNYGFDVVDKGCCGTGDLEVSFLCNKLSPTCSDDTKYLFWDSYHPTETGYKILINNLLQKYISSLG